MLLANVTYRPVDQSSTVCSSTFRKKFVHSDTVDTVRSRSFKRMVGLTSTGLKL